MTIFENADAVWHMNNLLGGENCPYEFLPEGKIRFVELSDDEKRQSQKRGGDGRAIVLEDACLRLNMYQTVRYRPKNNAISVYLRVKIEENTAGSLFYSDFLALELNRSGLFLAYAGVKVKGGAVYREIPLCYREKYGWQDIILTVSNGAISFYIDGVRRARYDIPQDLESPFQDDLIIGGFRCCKPDTYSNGAVFAKFSKITYDTAVLWTRGLSDREIAELSGVFELSKSEYDGEDIAVMEIARLHNKYFDASAENDAVRCREIWNKLKEIEKNDEKRPLWHLTQPFGFIFDPCGAFYHGGKYHVYSYHNIEYLLNYSSLDHYASDDLVHWYGMPIGPFADSPSDAFCIYLMNHFYDDEGNVRALYTGHGFGGKTGVLARVSDDMTQYTDKHPVITKYHHDGHVFKHDGKWYTITSKLCKAQREGDKGDPVMMWSSDDLEKWTEEGEIFCQKKCPETGGGFMEFPYLLNFGKKDALILGGHPVRYWVGHFDWKKKKFIPDQEESKLLDNTNPFHCFNPLCVDDKGEGGTERRILMAMYCDIGSGDRKIQWGCCHVMPRVLTLENGRLRQDPIPEIEKLHKDNFSAKNIKNNKLFGNNVFEGHISGEALDISATFDSLSKGKVGITLTDRDNEEDRVFVSYDSKTDLFEIGGNVLHGGKFKAYRKGDEIGLRIFTDRSLIEIFVNGESAVTSFRGDPAAKRKPSVVTEGKSNCREFKVWKM